MRILLSGCLTVAKSPGPLSGVACALIGKLNIKATGLKKEIRKWRCTIEIYGLANRQALTAYTGCLKAYLVSAGLRKSN